MSKVCEYCGKPLNGRNEKFCSRECTGKSVGKIRWKKINNVEYECIYNHVCACSNRKCDDCGWNPEVAKDRMTEILRKMKEETV